MNKLVIATKNDGKLKEIKDLLKDYNIHITSLADYPDAPQIIEDGNTFEENAIIKAKKIAEFTKELTMGEDSGLEVDALDGGPGIYSSRFSGNEATDKSNNEKLLVSLTDVPQEKRTARYQCCAALVNGNQVVEVVRGTCEGRITFEPKGNNGFGYDPYFLIEEYNQTCSLTCSLF